ncbi:hypothetical protein [Acinetobacter nosocomialis]|uniref:hypothetical protein n=1 Tax=Acinetobacter nosocomialis TaxID=106654 RepID=UPI001FF258B0|nr:hypothetical protein [Acinetobacter nosocomialis]MCJ9033640.1 hypothetical protein [Acinetobacter nosocomialis]
MQLFPPKHEVSNVSQDGQGNTQQIAATINNTYTNITTPLAEARKASILQEVIEDILELSVSLEVTELDVKIFDIEKKVDYNQIVGYKASFDFFMSNKQVIQSRLDVLESIGNPLATKKLFTVIRNIYHKYIHLTNPDEIIKAMQDELTTSLLTAEPDNYDNITFVPSVIFYVFSECQIFKLPLT